ncbi:MAG: EF-P beta-lysylation protein EpmB [Pirellulales bacterium]
MNPLRSPCEPSVRHVCEDGADWQQTLRDAVRDAAELCRALGLEPPTAGDRQAAADFRVFVPRPYLQRIRPGDPDDPLLRQVLPVAAETAPSPGFSHDPVGDRSAVRQPGLLHKYRGRALMVATGACAVHCRYCFRRHFPYDEAPGTLAGWTPALETLAADPSIHELILSGGDPLMLRDERLAELTEALAEIPHLRRLRVHTRLPVMIPARVNDELLGWLTGTRLAPWMVVHINHPREVDTAVGAALGRLVDAGVPVLNQAVLLRGINDEAEVLAELCELLVDLRVSPYYLHQLDRVAGAAHFEVSVEQGRSIVAELRRRLPGFAVPRYVCEQPGGEHKMLLE